MNPADIVVQPAFRARILVPTDLAPIALFVYNRPDHTRRAVESLKLNEYAAKSDLFVFADGPKTEAAAPAVREVRRFIRNIDGFRSVTIIEHKCNLGLSKSIIAGVTDLCNQFGKAIVVEDDLLTAPDFLTFVNRGLTRYEDEPNVFSVTGFNLPVSIPRGYPYDAFFSYRFLCWGWGTWKNRWATTDWSVSDFPQFIADRHLRKRFNRGGNDLSGMLARHVAGKIDSWDVVYAYTHFKHDALALVPTSSRVYNIGLDGSGTHCRRRPFAQCPLPAEASREYRFPERVRLDPYLVGEIQRLCHRSCARRLTRWVLDRVGG